MSDFRAAQLQELFQTSGLMLENNTVDWLNLPAFVRVLLSTDGTVTKSLEAYFWEPVSVIVQKQGLVKASAVNSDFVSPEFDSLWSRDVLLVGQESSRCYVNASSLIAYSVLPVRLKLALTAGELGIGEIIRELGMETYRKIVAVGSGNSLDSDRDFVWRVYQIYYQGQILMTIREEFALSVF